MRKLVPICALLLAALSCVRAQEQEKKLVDRLLKPDMDLKNEAQDKKFIAGGSAINKRATVGSFYLQKKSNSNIFWGIPDFLAHPFKSRSFHSRDSAFNTSPNQTIGNSRFAFTNQTPRGVRDASQSDNKVAVRGYGNNRPFLEEGKSQKSLNRQNAPLTIEQVRELLNKNK